MNLRLIQASDNFALADILRKSLEEFDVPKEGTVYTDPTTDNLFELFCQPKSMYYVAEEHDQILGGCGVYPTPALPAGYAELVKFYLSPQARGKGAGKMLLNTCFEKAVDLGYTHLYLESFPQFEKAVEIYQKAGFSFLDHPLGNSGHYACTVWMVKELNS